MQPSILDMLRSVPRGTTERKTEASAAEKSEGSRHSQFAGFLATDDVPDTIFGIRVVQDKSQYAKSDLEFFRKHPEAGGFYDLGDDVDTTEGDIMGGIAAASIRLKNGRIVDRTKPVASAAKPVEPEPEQAPADPGVNGVPIGNGSSGELDEFLQASALDAVSVSAGDDVSEEVEAAAREDERRAVENTPIPDNPVSADDIGSSSVTEPAKTKSDGNANTWDVDLNGDGSIIDHSMDGAVGGMANAETPRPGLVPQTAGSQPQTAGSQPQTAGSQPQTARGPAADGPSAVAEPVKRHGDISAGLHADKPENRLDSGGAKRRGDISAGLHADKPENRLDSGGAKRHGDISDGLHADKPENRLESRRIR